MMGLAFLTVAMLPAFLIRDLRGCIYTVPKGYDDDWPGFVALYFCFWGTIAAVFFIVTTTTRGLDNGLFVMVVLFCVLGPIFSSTASGNSRDGKILFICITIFLWMFPLVYFVNTGVIPKAVKGWLYN